MIALRVAACYLYAFLLSVGSALNLGVVWHERNVPEAMRTVINRLTADMCLALAGANATILTYVLMIFLFDNFPEGVCSISIFVMVGLVVSACFFADSIVIFRYLYTCRYKNVGIFDEDFIKFFINAEVCLFTGYLILLFGWFGQTHKSSYFNVCSEREEEGNKLQLSNFGDMMRSIVLATLVLHVVLYTRITVSRRSLEKKVLRTCQAGTTGSNNHYDITKNSFVKVGTTVAALLMVAVGYLLVKFASDALLDAYPSQKKIAMVLRPTFNVFVGCEVVPFLYYLGNADMRKKVTGFYVRLLRKVIGAFNRPM